MHAGDLTSRLPVSWQPLARVCVEVEAQDLPHRHAVQAMIGNPQLVIVDGPTAGLDPGERNLERTIDAQPDRENERVNGFD